MNPNQVVDQAKTKLAAALEHFNGELNKLRTGRAHPSMLDGIMVEAYGVPTPLNQVSTISTPEAQLLQISPFDPSNVGAITTAIRNNPSLGLNPTDDGRVIRVPVPPLTEERRRELAKQVGQKQEDCMVALRGVRHDAMDSIANAKKAKEVGEDDAKRLEKQVDDSMNATRAQAEATARSKEAEIMKV